MRVSGKSLFFMDIEQDGHILQVVCLAGHLSTFAGLNTSDFQRLYRLIRRGDIVCEHEPPE